MRLKTFLKEGLESTKAWNTISLFDESQQKLVKQMFDSLKHYKLVDEYEEGGKPPSPTDGKITFTFSDGLVTISLIISTFKDKESEKIEISFMMVAAKVNEKLLLPVMNNKADITFFSVFTRSDTEKVQENLQTFKETIDNFSEWYFDMSGKYGKVKLLKTFYDILGNFHDTKKPRFVAIAGDFEVSDEISDHKQFAVEPRVL